MSYPKEPKRKTSLGLLIGGALTSIGASICCIGALVQLGLGIGGAWLSSLARFEPYRPIFIILTILCLSPVFYRLYFTPTACTGSICANLCTLNRRRVAFWIVAIFSLGAISIPWLMPLLYRL